MSMFCFCKFLFCNYICSPTAIGYTHVNIARGWSGFSGRIRGSGIIRIVETSENDWNDFVLTWLHFRLIVMWLVMGIRAVWVQKELQQGVKYSVYHQEGTAIFLHLNFSFKREEPFCILRCSTQLHLNPHSNFECKTPRWFYCAIILANCVHSLLLLSKSILQYQQSIREHCSWHRNDWTTAFCHAVLSCLDKHKQH